MGDRSFPVQWVKCAITLWLVLAPSARLTAQTPGFPIDWVKNRLHLDEDKLRRAEQRKELLLRELDWPRAPRSVSILVRKAERQLVLSGDGRVMLKRKVGLGQVPVGHKQRQGDNRTPEGDYIVCLRNANSQFHLFLGLSYPSAADAERGLAAGLITKAQHRRIVRASAAGRQPPWETALGGAVGIHGSGSNWDWTLGCIALDDPDIEVLWALCPVGTPVHIEP
ncbi:MAG: L,D-transpeptidase family protein [Vicinamibacteria bacterium]|jgi:murein L,D-transpeptidase YafK|nr:L,D-transpeptidase family protein [Vicinamibacteria bacterium]